MTSVVRVRPATLACVFFACGLLGAMSGYALMLEHSDIGSSGNGAPWMLVGWLATGGSLGLVAAVAASARLASPGKALAAATAAAVAVPVGALVAAAVGVALAAGLGFVSTPKVWGALTITVVLTYIGATMVVHRAVIGVDMPVILTLEAARRWDGSWLLRGTGFHGSRSVCSACSSTSLPGA